MNKKEFAKGVFIKGALLYTLVSACILIISALVTGDSGQVTETGGQFLKISTHLFLLIYAYIASLASNICKIEKIPYSAKLFIHAAGYIGGFFFFFVLPLNRGFSGSVMLTLGFAAAYVIVRVLISIITYDEKGAKQNASDKSSKKSSTVSNSNSSAKVTKKSKPAKMKDEEYTSLFSSKSSK